MICKNCKKEIQETAKYCQNCGAEVVKERMTLKKIWNDLVSKFFGWDNKYFFTLIQLLRYPENIFKDYLSGVRKKYVAPFTFLAIGVTLATLVFNHFSEQYVAVSRTTITKQTDFFELETSLDSTKTKEFELDKRKRIESGVKAQEVILKYFNFYTFLLLPFYSLIAFWVFGKSHNYAEHLIINSYLQGVIFILSTLLFLLSIWIDPFFYLSTLVFTVVYYSYAYKRLYKYGYGKLLLKLIKFIAILLGFFLLIVIGTAIAVIIKKAYS